MAAAEEYTWDVAPQNGGARRPSLEDVGGARLEDDAAASPLTYDGSEPYADQLNEMARQSYAAAKMADAVRLTFDYANGAPEIVHLRAPSLTLVPADFTVTPNGVGEFVVSWLTLRLPPPGCDPTLSVNALGRVTGSAVRELASPTPEHTSIRIQTYDNGALANLRCTMHID